MFQVVEHWVYPEENNSLRHFDTFEEAKEYIRNALLRRPPDFLGATIQEVKVVYEVDTNKRTRQRYTSRVHEQIALYGLSKKLGELVK